jgi:hypothetical protein
MTQFSSLYTARLDRELGTDDSTELFTTARRKAAVNEGIQEFAKLTDCFQRRSTVAITGGTAEYDLNSTDVIAGGDFARFSKEQVEFRYTDAAGDVTVLAGDDLVRRDVEWLNRYEVGWQDDTTASSVQQLPVAYYERFDNGSRLLGFYPKPCTGSSASAVAIVPYIAQPPVLTSDTSEPFSGRLDLRPYHQGLVHFAAYQLEKLRRDDNASDRQLQRFIGYVQQYLQDMRRRGGSALTFAKSYFRRPSIVTGEDPRR